MSSLRAIVVRVALAFVCVLAVGTGLGSAAVHGMPHIDTAVTRDLSRMSRAHHAVEMTMKAVTLLGSTAWLFPVVAAVALVLAARGARGRAAWLVVAVGLGVLVSTVLKHVVGRHRPPFALIRTTGASFPSGHAMAATVTYGALVLVLAGSSRPRTRAVMVTCAGAVVAAVAFTRLALGVHYPTDVLGGMLLGALWLALISFAVPARGRVRPRHASGA